MSGKNTWDATDWANVFLITITGHDWGVPRFLVNDKDFKFMSFFGETFFDKLGTKLLTFMIYYPQTDKQSERTNQTIEIAFRYFFVNNFGIDFVNALPYIQSVINNAVSTSTDLRPNEIIYGFRFNDTLQTITDFPFENFDRFRFIYKKQTEKSIVWVNAITNHRYDQQHAFINFPVGSKTFFRLHHGYIILGIPNKKLNQQRTGPFTIKKKMVNWYTS